MLSPSHRNGFISTFFLVLLLSASLVSGIILQNDMNRMQTIINLQEYTEIGMAEQTVLETIKKRLHDDSLTDGFYTVSDIEFEISADDGRITAFLTSPVRETICITIDSDTRRISDCTFHRFGESF